MKTIKIIDNYDREMLINVEEISTIRKPAQFGKLKTPEGSNLIEITLKQGETIGINKKELAEQIWRYFDIFCKEKL